MRLSFQVDPKGKVPVKVISKTFASGKTEKLVYQGLADMGLPSGKVSFTFDSNSFLQNTYFKLIISKIFFILQFVKIKKFVQRYKSIYPL